MLGPSVGCPLHLPLDLVNELWPLVRLRLVCLSFILGSTGYFFCDEAGVGWSLSFARFSYEIRCGGPRGIG